MSAPKSSRATTAILICLLLMTSGCATAAPGPSRVVSINLCTDQLLLLLADPGQIASISHLARDPDNSFLAEQAAAFTVNHARFEELLTLKPDLLLAGTHSEPRLLRSLQGLGLQVEQFGLTHSIQGIKADIQRLAELLGQPLRGRELLETMETKIAHSSRPQTNDSPKALFYQPRGYTSGKRTLQDTALRAAGWRNIAAEFDIAGYAPIDLETLLLARPQQLFTSKRSVETRSRAQRQLHHSALRHLIRERPMREIPYKYWICAGPMIADAIHLLSLAHDD